VRIKGRPITRIIREKIIYASVVAKPILSPEKINVMAVTGYRTHFEEILMPLAVSLRKKVIYVKIK
jgi:hypothetical protein